MTYRIERGPWDPGKVWKFDELPVRDEDLGPWSAREYRAGQGDPPTWEGPTPIAETFEMIVWLYHMTDTRPDANPPTNYRAAYHSRWVVMVEKKKGRSKPKTYGFFRQYPEALLRGQLYAVVAAQKNWLGSVANLKPKLRKGRAAMVPGLSEVIANAITDIRSEIEANSNPVTLKRALDRIEQILEATEVLRKQRTLIRRELRKVLKI